VADGVLARALAAVGGSGAPVPLRGSMSQSGVYRVCFDGGDAVLKVTGADGQRDIARRELTFYQTLANDVPVRTPTLLGHADNADFTAILLSVHTPSAPAREWQRAEFLEVTRQLAALHSTPMPAGEPWTHVPWLDSVLADPPVSLARDYWSLTDAAGSVGSVLDEPLGPALGAVPDCFVHGDCHVDNLLRDGDDLVWTDWQVTGIGAPGADLAFLLGRAYSDSADPPRAEMIELYAHSRGLDVGPFRRAVLAAELGFVLFGWPEYAHYHSADEQERTVRRLIDLIGEWKFLTRPVSTED
jgi:Ser/Thr protein kinase RdoA (MazF antagonist)